MKRLIIFIFIYVFIFSIHLVFFPIRLRLLLSVFGFYYLYKDRRYIVLPSRQKKRFISLYRSAMILLIVVIISSVINSNWDTELLKYPISILMSLSSAYCLLRILFYICKDVITTDELQKWIVGIALFECVIAVILFLVPAIKDFIFSIVYYNEMAQEAHEMDEGGIRMMGMGAQYFGGGIFMSLALFYIAILLRKVEKTIHIIGLLVSFAIISMIGSAIARTTLVGALISFMYIVASLMSKGRKKYVVVLFVFFVFASSIWIYQSSIKDNALLEASFERAFSVVETSFDNKKIERTGVGDYTEPDETKTWIIGDAKMADPQYPTLKYYKGIDIGIWRLIWGYGICGLIAYCFVQWQLCRLTGFLKSQYYILFVLFILFLNKGISPMDHLFSLFIMIPVIRAFASKKSVSTKIVKKLSDKNHQ